MRNIWMLAKANIRKSKGQTLSMALLIFVAAMFLNIGLVLYFGTSTFFDERARELNTAHFATLRTYDAPSDAQKNFIRQFPGVAEVELQLIVGGVGSIFVDNAQNNGALLFASINDVPNMNPPVTIGNSLPFLEDSMYLPRALFLNSDFSIGDSITIGFMEENLYFTIAGSVEDILFDGESWRMYVSESRFQTLQELFPDSKGYIISARMDNIDDTVLLSTAYIREFFGTEHGIPATLYGLGSIARRFPVIYNVERDNRLFVPLLVAIFISAFSLIILAVGLIITRFRIINSIEESMTNLGALKAMGYRNYQLIMSFVIQFGIVSLIGGLLGLMFAQIFMSDLIQISESQLGLVWNPGFNGLMFILSLAFILGLTLLFTIMSSWRINKLYPIAALRGGLSPHSFKKNYFPLDKSKRFLILQLALKQLLQEKKQAFMILIVIAAVTFISVIGISTYYNINVNTDAIVKMVAGVDANIDIMVGVNNVLAAQEFQQRMEANPDVDRIFGFQHRLFFIEEVLVLVRVVEDFSYLAGYSLVEGRLPRHDNEIVISAPALFALGKELGDWVTVSYGGNEQIFMVTGVTQSHDFGGISAMVCMNGARTVQYDFMFASFGINLASGVSESLFVDELRNLEGSVLHELISLQEQIAADLDDIGGIFAIVTSLILLVVSGVVTAVLFIVIKTSILRKKREIGIQKAIGFTTLQLMNQTAINLTPTIILGVIIGAMGGYFSFNPMIAVLMSGMGIVQADMSIPANYTLVLCVALLILSYCVSMLISWRIRKISAYALVTE